MFLKKLFLPTKFCTTTGITEKRNTTLRAWSAKSLALHLCSGVKSAQGGIGACSAETGGSKKIFRKKRILVETENVGVFVIPFLFLFSFYVADLCFCTRVCSSGFFL